MDISELNGDRQGGRRRLGRLLGLIVLVGFGAGCDPGSTGTGAQGMDGSGRTATTREDTGLYERHYDVGQCVIWDQSDSERAIAVFGGFNTPRYTRIVPCSEPHFFEITGGFRAPGDSDYPDADWWNDVFRTGGQGCKALAERYLDGPVDPYGKFALTGMKPSPELWAKSERQIWCALAGVRWVDDGKGGGQMLIRGSVRSQAQSMIYDVGACLGVRDGSQQVSGQVPCDQLHGFEVTSSVDLGHRAQDRPTSKDDWWALVGTDCRRSAETYLGRPIDGRTLRVTYLEIRLESWAAGRRQVECLVGRYDAEGNKVLVASPLRDQGT